MRLISFHDFIFQRDDDRTHRCLIRTSRFGDVVMELKRAPSNEKTFITLELHNRSNSPHMSIGYKELILLDTIDKSIIENETETLFSKCVGILKNRNQLMRKIGFHAIGYFHYRSGDLQIIIANINKFGNGDWFFNWPSLQDHFKFHTSLRGGLKEFLKEDSAFQSLNSITRDACVTRL